jgi:hypothetical protein
MVMMTLLRTDPRLLLERAGLRDVVLLGTVCFTRMLCLDGCLGGNFISHRRCFRLLVSPYVIFHPLA